MLLIFFSSCSDDNSSSEKTGSTDIPEPSRFTQKVIADGLEEPLQMEFDRQGRIYWIERTGNLRRVDELTGRIEELGKIPVAGEPAPGLVGFLLDKDFEKNRKLYLYYSAAEDEGAKMRLSLFTLTEDHRVNMDSEIIMLEVPWEYPDGNHFGGGMVWDKEGNLLISIGGDTTPSQYSPMAFTNEGGKGQDEARTAGNTNDLRGSILRITPHSNGSYSIPKNNLFAEGTPNTRKEIFVMGNRNPWRLSIDSKTGYLHWGEIGPDAGVDSKIYGPMGYDEFNVAKEAGNFGWPFVIGKNLPYKKYDYETDTYGDFFDPEAPINDSPNNTGLRELPPAQPALVAYPYRVSGEWPVLGSAGRSAVGGPVFRQADFPQNIPGLFPEYYEGKWFVTDYVRNWIMIMTMDKERTQVTSIEPFLPPGELSHSQPLDMDFGPGGDLYIVEYGQGAQGRLSKIQYNSGNRAPIAIASAEPSTGAIPLEVRLLSYDSKDPDGDRLEYNWTVTPAEGGEVQKYNQENPLINFGEPGKYQVELTVSDPEGKIDTDSLEILAGNEAPNVQMEISSGNRSFYFPDEMIEYNVRVTDHEDGNLVDGDISPEEISVTAEYVPSGINSVQLTNLREEGLLEPNIKISHIKARSLMTINNCFTCHKNDAELIGPSFMDIAEEYKEDAMAFEKLTQSILEGSSDKWGTEIPMPPHPTLDPIETREIIKYIFDLASASGNGKHSLPVKGKFQTKVFESQGGNGRLNQFFSPPYELGSYVLHASYTDDGNEEQPGLELTSDDFVLLRYPLLGPESADFFSEEGISFTPSTNDPGFIFTGQGGFIGFRDIDLTGITKINIGAITRFWHWSHFVGATIELRLESPTGKLVGEPFEIIPPETAEGEGPFYRDDWEKPIPVDVSQLNGMNDIYIIVQNSGAEESDALIIMTGIEFENSNQN